MTSHTHLEAIFGVKLEHVNDEPVESRLSPDFRHSGPNSMTVGGTSASSVARNSSFRGASTGTRCYVNPRTTLDAAPSTERKNTPGGISKDATIIKVERPSSSSPPQSSVVFGNSILNAQRRLLSTRVQNPTSEHGPDTSQTALQAPYLGESDYYGIHTETPEFASGAVDESLESADLMELQDSNDWMDNYCSSGDDDHDLHNLKVQVRALERAQRQGPLSPDDKHQLFRATTQIAGIEKRKRLTDRDDSEDDLPLFVSNNSTVADPPDETPEETASRRLRYSTAADEELALVSSPDFKLEQVEARQRSRREGRQKAAKPRKRIARNAREVEEDRREKEHNKTRRINSRSVGRSATPQRGRGAKCKVRTVRKGETTHKSRMRQGVGADSLYGIIEDLLHNDVVQDRIDQDNYGEAPTFNERTVGGQFKALMAAVPDTYDVHRKKVDKRTLQNASRRFGNRRVSARDGRWLLKGMKSPLYHHQLLAADWMITRELSDHKPHGGLLADAMGLGKTLEILATMVGNLPTTEDIRRNVRSTLIVLPSSAIIQWMEEVKKHVNESVFPFRMHYKRSSNTAQNILENCDIVFCSYSEVMNSFPYPSNEDKLSIAQPGGLERWLEEAKSRQGVLHKIEWYRIVLDEAQAIKNNTSRTSLACQNLKGHFRWALSGTPIQNRLEELFPYFRFLRAEWTSDFDQFRKHFCDPDADDANARIAVILSIVMMRRTMKDNILGRPIIDLPPVHPETKHIEFSRAERTLYRILEDRFRQNLNHHFAAGTARRNYGVFMVQLLRLRQCTAHPFLLEQTIKDIFTLEDVRKLHSDVSRQGRDERPVYEQIAQWVQASAEERAAAEDRGEENPQAAGFGQDDFGKLFQMNDFLRKLDDNELQRAVTCAICGDFPDEGQITDCKCCFCRTCIESYIHQQRSKDNSSSRDENYIACPACQRLFEAFIPYEALQAAGDAERELDSGSQNQPRWNNIMSTNPKPKVLPSEWLKMVETNNAELLPSAKLIAVKAQILKWIDEAPGDKILIFTQFRMMARLVGMVAERERWGHVYFTGDMNGKKRHKAVQDFHQNKNIRIMIANLKCGGQALNLTCANRVISLDLWWNHSVEQQAFGRVFRIGQHKETYVSRFVISNTVDMRMLDMQADKVIMIDRAMQDVGETVAPLSIMALASLFGHLRENEDGVMVVEPDYEDGDEGVRAVGEKTGKHLRYLSVKGLETAMNSRQYINLPDYYTRR